MTVELSSGFVVGLNVVVIGTGNNVDLVGDDVITIDIKSGVVPDEVTTTGSDDVTTGDGVEQIIGDEVITIESKAGAPSVLHGPNTFSVVVVVVVVVVVGILIVPSFSPSLDLMHLTKPVF